VKSTLAALGAAVLLCGCSRNIDNKEAVRQGVIDYLNNRTSQTGLDMKLMNVDVSSVTFTNNEANATVSFQPKGGGAQGMAMNYVLERRGDKWVVKGRKESGVNPHGGQAAPAMPGEGALPPGHPPTTPATPDKK
jgi:hypothetical protein